MPGILLLNGNGMLLSDKELTMTDQERRQGFFEGQVTTELKSVSHNLEALRKEILDFKQDVYDKVNNNSKEIAKQKGINTGLGILAGIVGGILREAIWGGK